MDGLSFLRCRTIDECLASLSRAQGNARIIAGGTDLIVDMREGRISPRCVLDISSIAALKYIERDGNRFRIGAMTTFAELERDERVRLSAGVLRDAVSEIGSPQIRNRGTLGGNVAKSSVAGDGLAALCALDSSVVLRSLRGERTLPLDQYLGGPAGNRMEADELLVEIHFDIPDGNSASAFYKLAKRKALGIVDIGGAAVVSLDSSGICTYARLFGGALARFPLKLVEAERMLVGHAFNRESWERISPALSAAVAESLKERQWEAVYKKEAVTGVFANVYETLAARLNTAG